MAALPLSYLVLANALLSSALIQDRISHEPERLLVRWGSAWSVWPGKVHVRNFYLRRQDPKRRFELVVDAAVTEVDLSALLERRFETAWVKASGVEFRLRPAVSGTDGAEDTRDYPPIEGLLDTPMGSEPAVAKPAPALDAPWSARLRNVEVVGIRQVWIGPYRATLDAAATGSLWLKPRHFFSVTEGTLLVRSGSVWRGELATASALTGTGACTIDIKNLPEEEGVSVLRSIDFAADFRGRLDSLGFLAPYLDVGRAISIRGGGATLALTASAVKGVLQAGTTLQLDGEEVGVEVGPYRVRGAWSASGLVSKSEDKLRTRMDVAVGPLRVESLAGQTRFESAGLRATLTASDLLLGQAPADGRIALDLVRTEPFALKLLNVYVAGDGSMIDTGRATVEATLLVTPTGKSGSLLLRTGSTKASLGRTRIRGEGVLDLDLAQLKVGPGLGSVDLSGSSVSFSNVEIISSRAWSRDWSGRLTLRSAQLSLRPALKGSAELVGVFSDARPFLALFGDQGGIPRWATPFLEAEGLKLSGSLSFTGSALELRNLAASGEGLAIRGRLDVTADDVFGVFLIRVQGFTVGLKLTGETVVSQLQDAENWFAKQLVAWKQ